MFLQQLYLGIDVGGVMLFQLRIWCFVVLWLAYFEKGECPAAAFGYPRLGSCEVLALITRRFIARAGDDVCWYAVLLGRAPRLSAVGAEILSVLNNPILPALFLFSGMLTPARRWR